MDCNSARLFLQFIRPGGPELDDQDAADLDAHLAHCSECNSLAASQNRLDQHIGRAMRAVEVPHHLKDHILQRLASEASGGTRWRLGRTARVLAIAASMLLCVGLWYAFYRPSVTQIDMEDLQYSYNVTPPAIDEVNAHLKSLGSSAVAPTFVNYQYLTGMPALAVLPGTHGSTPALPVLPGMLGTKPVIAPQLVFSRKPTLRDDPRRIFDHRAIVYVLPARKYELTELANTHPGYTFRLDYREEGGFFYLILHTGNDWRWLEASRRDDE